MLQRTQQPRRPGLTLIELIVVLVVLVALAGILVVSLPSMLGRAHTASGATNIGEVTKFVQVYEQLYQSHPTDLDALTDTTSTAIPDYLPSHGGTVLGGPTVVTSHPLTDEQAEALEHAGITRLAPMHPSRGDFTAANTPTFNPYSGPSVNVAEDVRVLRLSEAFVEGASGLVSEADQVNTFGDVYILLGFGKRCSMVGKVTTEPPTHFGDSAEENAANVYSRVGLVYRVSRGAGTSGSPVSADMKRAVFIGAVGLHGDGPVGGGAHIEEYYNITRAQ
ncbi:MAG: prepilin-type N-terminal cleavage/methylation domain-containing protein [Planctomycetia bacterium]|nr:prepilin-type N-terminal cleavage/methylation domain-containing protein [Planctomycetia bacterium]